MENLEHTKKTAAEIEDKVTEAKKTSAEIDKVGVQFGSNSLHEFLQARELYRSSAARASVLYFILNDLNRINPMYQFSLRAFSVVFDVAIKVSTHNATGNYIFSACCHGLECDPQSEESHRLHHFSSVPVHNKVHTGLFGIGLNLCI